VVLETTALA